MVDQWLGDGFTKLNIGKGKSLIYKVVALTTSFQVFEIITAKHQGSFEVLVSVITDVASSPSEYTDGHNIIYITKGGVNLFGINSPTDGPTKVWDKVTIPPECGLSMAIKAKGSYGFTIGAKVEEVYGAGYLS